VPKYPEHIDIEDDSPMIPRLPSLDCPHSNNPAITCSCQACFIHWITSRAQVSQTALTSTAAKDQSGTLTSEFTANNLADLPFGQSKLDRYSQSLEAFEATALGQRQPVQGGEVARHSKLLSVVDGLKLGEF